MLAYYLLRGKYGRIIIILSISLPLAYHQVHGMHIFDCNGCLLFHYTFFTFIKILKLFHTHTQTHAHISTSLFIYLLMGKKGSFICSIIESWKEGTLEETVFWLFAACMRFVFLFFHFTLLSCSFTSFKSRVLYYMLCVRVWKWLGYPFQYNRWPVTADRVCLCVTTK